MKAPARVVTFGELMLRLSPPGFERIDQATRFDIHFGGAEANCAVSLARWGLESWFVTQLPDNELGDRALSELRRHQVRTDHILRGGERMGIYFLEAGAAQRPSKVIYDRAGASVTSIDAASIRWDEVFGDKAWFHVTGITPALSPTLNEAVRTAVKKAKACGLTLSFDLNYRKKLWPIETARTAMHEIISASDIVFSNEEDLSLLFGLHPFGSDIGKGVVLQESFTLLGERFLNQFPNVRLLVISLRESVSASENIWSAVACEAKAFHASRKYRIHVVDRIGSGDALAAGMIFSLLKEAPVQEALEFAVAASCLKHSMPGDFNLASIPEIEALLSSGGSGRIQR